MDVQFFLHQRTRFIREFYDRSTAPFVEIKRLIEAEEPPYEPPYSEDGEPPFLDEWLDADTSIEVLGRTCVSMLSDSLKLFFITWERDRGLSCRTTTPSAFKKHGFIQGYLRCFEAASGIPWPPAPVDLDLIEQVVCARNDAQHPQEITSLNVQHRVSLDKPGRRLFFAHDFEGEAMADPDGEEMIFMNPALRITRDKLFRAIAEVEVFAAWLENLLLKTPYPHQTEKT